MKLSICHVQALLLVLLAGWKNDVDGFTMLLPVGRRPVASSLLSPSTSSTSSSLFSTRSKKKDNNNNMPANLKRKVSAKRPPLGHIIPEHTKTKGCKFLLIFLFYFLFLQDKENKLEEGTVFPWLVLNYLYMYF